MSITRVSIMLNAAAVLMSKEKTRDSTAAADWGVRGRCRYGTLLLNWCRYLGCETSSRPEYPGRCCSCCSPCCSSW